MIASAAIARMSERSACDACTWPSVGRRPVNSGRGDAVAVEPPSWACGEGAGDIGRRKKGWDAPYVSIPTPPLTTPQAVATDTGTGTDTVSGGAGAGVSASKIRERAQ